LAMDLGKRAIPISPSNKICSDPDIDEDAICSLTRLIGDSDKARARTRKLSSLMNKIETEDFNGEVEILKATADPCRFKILKLLMEGELGVCEIMTALKKPQSTTSHHLSILRESGLVKERRDGKWSYYRLADSTVVEMIKQVKALKKNKS
jgi:DNA-binding transcriptional ArsR family regulator